MATVYNVFTSFNKISLISDKTICLDTLGEEEVFLFVSFSFFFTLLSVDLEFEAESWKLKRGFFMTVLFDPVSILSDLPWVFSEKICHCPSSLNPESASLEIIF